MNEQSHDFATLVLPHCPLLRRRAVQLEGSQAPAEDLLHDTIERALLHFDAYAPGSNIVGWLLRIMTNLFLDRYRRRAFEVLSRKPEVLDCPAPAPRDPEYWECLSLADVRAATPMLPPVLRSVVDLQLAGTRSYRQIGARLGIPVRTVGTRVHRARLKLRTMLEADPSR